MSKVQNLQGKNLLTYSRFTRKVNRIKATLNGEPQTYKRSQKKSPRMGGLNIHIDSGCLKNLSICAINNFY